MKKVCVVIGNRADEGLTAPVRKRIGEHSDMELLELDVKNYDAKYFYLQNDPDLVLIPCDRYEALVCALEAFREGIPIAHMDAGELNVGGTRDDQYRWMITTMADLIFTNTEFMTVNVKKFLLALGKGAEVYKVGYTCFDDMQVDETAPEKPYDLVLYNMPKNLDDVPRDIGRITAILDKKTIWIHPSDKDEKIIKWIPKEAPKARVIIYENHPRPQFLSLLKDCERFIGNSSAQYHEARFFNKTCINVGARNSNREFAKKEDMKPGASDKIVKIIGEWLDDKNK